MRIIDPDSLDADCNVVCVALVGRALANLEPQETVSQFKICQFLVGRVYGFSSGDGDATIGMASNDYAYDGNRSIG